MKTYEGKLDAKGMNVAVIVSRFNGLVTSRLLTGALDSYRRLGGSDDDLTIVKVPGSFEVVLGARKLAESKKYDAIVCLGTVIRGDTPHFEYISQQLAKGISSVMADFGLPVAFGVITADSLDQAIARAGAKQGNKGEDAMMAAIETSSLIKQL